jgi:hypothetical protein
MLSIYNYMASGIVLSGIVALLFSQAAWLRRCSSHRRCAGWSHFAPLGFVMAMSFGLQKMQTSTLKALFWAFWWRWPVDVVVDLLCLHRFIDRGDVLPPRVPSPAPAWCGLAPPSATCRRWVPDDVVCSASSSRWSSS